MRGRYLELTYRKGRPLAGYLHLPRHDGDVAARSERADEDLVIDYAADGRPIGIELLSPATLTLEALNAVLAALKLPPAARSDLTPLPAAA